MHPRIECKRALQKFKGQLHQRKGLQFISGNPCRKYCANPFASYLMRHICLNGKHESILLAHKSLTNSQEDLQRNIQHITWKGLNLRSFRIP